MDYKKLVNFAARYTVVIILLVGSIGPLLAVALVDTVTFIVGSLWLLGDFIPCAALAILVHDIVTHDIFAEQRFQERDLIVIAIAGVYCLDLFIYSARSNHLSRNFQVIIAIIYLMRTRSYVLWFRFVRDTLTSLEKRLRLMASRADVVESPAVKVADVNVAGKQQIVSDKSAPLRKIVTTQQKTATQRKQAQARRRNTKAKGSTGKAAKRQRTSTAVRTSTRRSRVVVGCSTRPTVIRNGLKPKIKILQSLDVY